jgi:hypothetical protein
VQRGEPGQNQQGDTSADSLAFVQEADFVAEVALYQDRVLRRALPPLCQATANRDRTVTSRSGYVFPPFIVLERGVTLQVRLRADLAQCYAPVCTTQT